MEVSPAGAVPTAKQQRPPLGRAIAGGQGPLPLPQPTADLHHYSRSQLPPAAITLYSFTQPRKSLPPLAALALVAATQPQPSPPLQYPFRTTAISPSTTDSPTHRRATCLSPLPLLPSPPSARLPCCSHCCYCRFLFLPTTAHRHTALMVGRCLLLLVVNRHYRQPLHRSSQPFSVVAIAFRYSAQPSLPTASFAIVHPLPLQQPLLYLSSLPSSSSIAP
ncbi:hypothetical protein BHM03_00045432 [Ensete ventricosum]|nr:hypothetical protein BHM03_00045432 [Ensete ventricosum]